FEPPPLAVRYVVEEQGPLGPGGAPVVLVHFGIDVAVHFEQIEPAVVVVVDKTIAPANKGNSDLRDSHVVAHVGEAGVSIVVEEHLVVVSEVGVIEIDQSVVLVIAGGYS